MVPDSWNLFGEPGYSLPNQKSQDQSLEQTVLMKREREREKKETLFVNVSGAWMHQMSNSNPKPQEQDTITVTQWSSTFVTANGTYDRQNKLFST